MNQHLFRYRGRLVKAYRVSPMRYTGSWIEIEDYFTGEVKKLSTMADLEVVSEL